MSLTYDRLHAAVTGEAVGIRSRLELEPLGGPGDKIFPPPTARRTQLRRGTRSRIGW